MTNEEIKSLIESGVLESYVLGDLSAEEAERILSLCAQYPELKIELDKVEEDFEKIMMSRQVPVPSNITNDIFSKTVGKSSPIPTSKKTGLNNILLTVAAIVLLAVSYFYIKSREDQNNCKQENSALAARETDCLEEKAKTNTVLSFLTNRETGKYILEGTEYDKNAYAVLWYNPAQNEIMISTIGLPEIPETLSYQLWAIVEGTPVSLGVVSFSSQGISISLDLTSRPQAFAITVEPFGGQETPTLENMIVLASI